MVFWLSLVWELLGRATQAPFCVPLWRQKLFYCTKHGNQSEESGFSRSGLGRMVGLETFNQ